MLIEYYGHACFRLTEADYRIVIDPYGPDMIPGLCLPPIEAHQVLCTHEHRDHNYREGVKLSFATSPSPFTITEIASFHDDAQGSNRGTNKILLIETNELRIAHCGDLGCTLTNDQVEKLQNLDFLMVPVGGHYTIDAQEAKNLMAILKPKTTIPMHYKTSKSGFPILKDVHHFLDLFSEEEIYKHQALSYDPSKDVVGRILYFDL